MKKSVSCAPFLLAVLLLLFSIFGFSEQRFQGGGHFMLGFPQGEFKDNVDRAGLGGNFCFAYHFPRSMLSAGISFGFLIYGSETRTEPLSPTIPELVVDVRTTNSILLCHAFLRVQPQRGMIRPYLDGLAGLSYLTTDTSIHGSSGWDGAISSNNYDDLAFSYGAGVGAMVSLVQIRKEGWGSRYFSVELDLGARYLKGGEAGYLKKGSIHRENGLVVYDVYRSKTDLFKTYVGVCFGF